MSAQHMPGQRAEFEMSAADLEVLLDSMQPVPYMVVGGIAPRSRQENANAAWCALGNRMGFDGMSVQPSSKGERFFTAITKATAAQTARVDASKEAV